MLASREIERNIVRHPNGAALELSILQLNVQGIGLFVVTDSPFRFPLLPFAIADRVDDIGLPWRRGRETFRLRKAAIYADSMAKYGKRIALGSPSLHPSYAPSLPLLLRA